MEDGRKAAIHDSFSVSVPLLLSSSCYNEGMQKSTLIAILLVFMMGFFARATSVQAQFFEKNNKMWIHVATPSEQDIKDAAKLVNANSSWGYITIVLQQKDSDKKALQHTCDLLRDAKLIPIWRLASRAE